MPLYNLATRRLEDTYPFVTQVSKSSVNPDKWSFADGLGNPVYWFDGTASWAESSSGGTPATASHSLTTKAAGIEWDIQLNSASAVDGILGVAELGRGYYNWNAGAWTFGNRVTGSGAVLVGSWSFHTNKDNYAIGEYSIAAGYRTIAVDSADSVEGYHTATVNDTVTSLNLNFTYDPVAGTLTSLQPGDFTSELGSLNLNDVNTGVWFYNSVDDLLYPIYVTGAPIYDAIADRTYILISGIFGSIDNTGNGFIYYQSYNSTTKGEPLANHAEGDHTIASGDASHAEGKYTWANAVGSHAEGLNTISSNSGSHAEGRNTQAKGDGSHAEGSDTIASGSSAHAEGYATLAQGEFSHAEGFYTIASGSAAHAGGRETLASGYGSKAIGYQTEASGKYSMAAGYQTLASGDYSHAEGSSIYINPNTINLSDVIDIYTDWNDGNGLVSLNFYPSSIVSFTTSQLVVTTDLSAITSFPYSLPELVIVTATNSISVNLAWYGPAIIVSATYDAILDQTTFNFSPSLNQTYNSVYISKLIASGSYSYAGGWGNLASGVGSHAIGATTTASGYFSRAEGTGTKAIGNYSHAEGQNTQAIGDNSHAEGSATWASESGVHAEGVGTVGMGIYSHVEGYFSLTGPYASNSHAEGRNTQTVGESAHSEGFYTIASGSYSHAEGSGSISRGTGSHAEGYTTIALGTGSHAEGLGTISSGNYSHAEGRWTTASGISSHAEGINTLAYSNYTHTEGNETKTYGVGSHAEGYLSEAGQLGWLANVSGSSVSMSSTYGDLSAALGGLNPLSTGQLYVVLDGTEFGNSIMDQYPISTANIGFNGSYTYINLPDTLGGTTQPIYVGFVGSNSSTIATANGASLAMGDYSHAEGRSARSIGNWSHAEGKQSVAIGEYSHAAGEYTVALGKYSHANGLYVVASGSHQTAVGRYNIETNVDDYFVIGDGTSNAARSNAFGVNNQRMYASNSIFFPDLTDVFKPHILVFDTGSKQVFYYTGSGLGGGGGPSNISFYNGNIGALLTSAITGFYVTGSGITATNVGGLISMSFTGGAGTVGPGTAPYLAYFNSSNTITSNTIRYDLAENRYYVEGNSVDVCNPTYNLGGVSSPYTANIIEPDAVSLQNHDGSNLYVNNTAPCSEQIEVPACITNKALGGERLLKRIDLNAVPCYGVKFEYSLTLTPDQPAPRKQIGVWGDVGLPTPGTTNGYQRPPYTETGTITVTFDGGDTLGQDGYRFLTLNKAITLVQAPTYNWSNGPYPDATLNISENYVFTAPTNVQNSILSVVGTYPHDNIPAGRGFQFGYRVFNDYQTPSTTYFDWVVTNDVGIGIGKTYNMYISFVTTMLKYMPY